MTPTEISPPPKENPMTTTILDPIRYVIYQSHLDGDGSTTDAQADQYAANLATVLRRAYPGREVSVNVRRRVSGVGSGLQGEPDGVDAQLVRHLADGVFEAGGVCSEDDCLRPLRADGYCASHYQQRRRTSAP